MLGLTDPRLSHASHVSSHVFTLLHIASRVRHPYTRHPCPSDRPRQIDPLWIDPFGLVLSNRIVPPRIDHLESASSNRYPRRGSVASNPSNRPSLSSTHLARPNQLGTNSAALGPLGLVLSARHTPLGTLGSAHSALTTRLPAQSPLRGLHGPLGSAHSECWNRHNKASKPQTPPQHQPPRLCVPSPNSHALGRCPKPVSKSRIAKLQF